MKRILTLSIAALLVTATFAGFVGTVTAQEEDSPSPPEKMDTSTVDNSTAVIILGERYRTFSSPITDSISSRMYLDSTDSQTVVNPAVVSGNAIASKHNLPVFYVGVEKNMDRGAVTMENRIIPITQVINQLKKKGNLDNVILVGEDESRNNQVADVFLSNDIEVRDQIYHNVDGPWFTNFAKASKQITRRAVLHQWESADNLILLPTTYKDTSSLLSAYSNESIDGTPVLFWNGYASGKDYARPVADYLDANLVDYRHNIDDGIRIRGSARGKALHSVDNTTETVVVLPKVYENRNVMRVGDYDGSHVSPIILQAAQMGSLNNSGMLIAEGVETLGDDARQKIQGMDENGTVILLGYNSEVTDSITIDATKAAPENATVEKVTVNKDPLAHRHRVGLLTYGYPNGVMISNSEKVGSGYFVEMSNIGYESIPAIDNRSVEMVWTGGITSSTPEGEQQGDEWVVTYDEEVEPGETFTVNVDGDDFAVYGQPTRFSYRVSSSGGIIGSGQNNNPIPGLGSSANILIGLIVLAVVVGGGYLGYRRGWHKGLVPEVSI